MAFGWTFKTRNPARDRDTDIARVQRLAQAIADIRTSAANELAGLEARYEATTADAAFLHDAIENRDADEASNADLDAMVDNLKRYHARRAALSRQLEILDEINGRAASLIDAAGEPVSG